MRTSARLAVVLASVVCATVGFPVRGAAQEDEATARARKHYQQAQKEFDLGNWDSAVREFSWAYELRPDPIFLYDMAQAYRRGGNLQRAIDLYKNYLIKDPKSPKRNEVEQRVVSLQRQLDDERPASRAGAAEGSSSVAQGPKAAAASAPADSAAELEPPAEPALSPGPATPSSVEQPGPAGPQVTVEPTVPTPSEPVDAAAGNATASVAPVSQSSVSRPVPGDSVARPAAPSASTRGHRLRVAGIVTGAVGLAATGAGVYFSLRTRSLSDEVANADRFNPADARAGQRASVAQWICYGTGAAGLAAGIFLYWLGSARVVASSRVSLVPVVGPEGTLLATTGTF